MRSVTIHCAAQKLNYVATIELSSKEPDCPHL